MQKARELLMEKQMTVSEVAYFIGYNNIGSFSAEFKKRFGYTPRQL
jgi:AraC family transcriptional regulator, transcriptional activator of the genes for pyochelin and ferripyochelin receptors